ncbi:MAG TPA: PLP-dependent transferase [Verrucomicrobiales bacterium]|nr:PLP-dependent transferase [Verrucomicrobiales bacterium]
MAEFETRAIHTGLGFREETGAVIPPPWLTSTFAAGNPGGFDYTRSGNPSFRNLAETLASLEGARYATVFASGVSAITAVVSGLRQGDRIVAEENLYGCTFRLFEQVFRKFGLRAAYEDFTEDGALDRVRLERPALVWIESPTNPLLKIIDIAKVAEVAREAGSCLVVDNTFASSYLQQPLRLGAHLSLLSTTKYTGGHSDVLGGAVCADDAGQHERLEFAQKALGLQPSPFDCWLLSRGVKTQALRMERHCANALAFAEYLERDTPACWVRYPFLPSHPQERLARRQMRGGSGIVTADFGWPAEKTREFLGRLKLFTLAESLGGIESLACHPATMTHASVPRERREAVGITDSLVRFSVGIEHVEDLRRDVMEALAQG